MAFASEQLVRVGQVTADNGTIYSRFIHATTAAVATVAAAGYFNAARAKLKVGDIVDVSCGIGGTPVIAVFRFATVPASGNVTTAGGTVTTT